MNKSTGDNTQTRKKRASATGTLVGTRFQESDLSRIDAWIARNGPPFVSRPEAIRRLVEKGLVDAIPNEREG
ncbi:MAG: hypothetical protein E6Q40_04480 [Cupriavidus sp.]|nr:MAG: hypothetical protein E6Q40_04480 [Cupriavidus sp.]